MRKFLCVAIVSLTINIVAATTAIEAAPVRTIFLFKFQQQMNPAVVNCKQFFEKVESVFPLTSEEYAIRSTTESSCTDGPTTDAHFHILLAAEDEGSAAELERYMEATTTNDLWGVPVQYHVVKKLVQTISIDTGTVTFNDKRKQYTRSNIEHVIVIHEHLGEAIKVLKGFKKDFARGNVGQLITFLSSISQMSYSDYILPQSNVIEVFLSTVVMIEGGDIYAIRQTRSYLRDCGIAMGKTCIDQL